MSLQVTTIMLGVQDLGRAKKFYADGLGCAIDKDYPGFVLLEPGPWLLVSWRCTSGRRRRPMPACSAEGSGFTGISFHYIVASRDEVDRDHEQRGRGRRCDQ